MPLTQIYQHAEHYSISYTRGGGSVTWQGQCHYCPWGSRDVRYPGTAESRVRDHLRDKHKIRA